VTNASHLFFFLVCFLLVFFLYYRIVCSGSFVGLGLGFLVEFASWFRFRLLGLGLGF